MVSVVDDDKLFVAYLVDMLKSKGYRTVVGFDGSDAIKLASTVLPDLIVLNVVMPNVDGFEAFKIIRNHPKTKTIKIIITSASTKYQGRFGMADGFFTKPVDTVELLRSIVALVGPPFEPGVDEKQRNR